MTDGTPEDGERITCQFPTCHCESGLLEYDADEEAWVHVPIDEINTA